MEIITNKNDSGIVIFSLNGRLDANTAPDLQKQVKQIIDNDESQLLFNFQDITYVSSAGLRVLITTVKLLKPKQGKLVLSNMAPAIFEVLKVAGFTKIFTICDTQQEALDCF